MTQTFIPGWETTLTLNSEDLTVVGNVLGFGRSKTALPKPVFGSPARNELGGQYNTVITAEGHLSAEKIAALEAMFALESIAFSIQAGTAAGTTDAGAWTGLCVVIDYELSTDAESQWGWTITANVDGVPTYTPATP